MSNRERRLDAMFEHARNQPALVSPEEASAIIDRSESVPGVKATRRLMPLALLALIFVSGGIAVWVQQNADADREVLASQEFASSIAPDFTRNGASASSSDEGNQDAESIDESVRRSGSVSNPFDDALHTEPVTEPVAQTEAVDPASSEPEPVDEPYLSRSKNGLDLSEELRRPDRLAARAVMTAEVSPRVQHERIDVTPLGDEINVPDFDDYNPMVTADGRTLYFVSNRPHGLGGHDFWVASKQERGGLKFSEPHNLGSSINTPGSEGAATISSDGTLIVFTACNRPDGLGDCDLYEAELHGAEWENVRNLASVNSERWDSQPALSADGRTLLFVSDRTGSVGGFPDFDIWISVRGNDGSWTKPRNLGSTINTPGKEDSPFLAADGSLYFSSEGHPGHGGLDFFVSAAKGSGTWGTPVNLGRPINSERDERFISLPAAGDVVYFASEAPGSVTRALDLFMARRAVTTETAVLHGEVSLDGESLEGVDLLFLDVETSAILGHSRLNSETDEYSLVLGNSSTTRRIRILALTATGETFDLEIPISAAPGYQEWRCDILVSRETVNTSNLTGPRIAHDLEQDLLTLTMERGDPIAFEILDIWGNVLSAGTVSSDQDFVTSASSMPDGLYLLSIPDGSTPFRIRRASE